MPPGLRVSPGLGLDAGQQVGPAGGVGQVVGPQVSLDEDTMPGGGITDPLVGGQLVRIFGGLEALQG